ncbi:hypothetical protein A1O1_02710 [Capronia coronata CBS 617.96]|uniref:Ion transport domain-containing protein n=1 Tax=Capronia coronata CBS 617.96 TaxID=1182541 RepID=W9YYF3_9EURO|nr:uncharacterized protein A1O1_02710 [Capronia coronata CBS 617.96]EXJ94316.1 hypothetical protein A1O1_02710 [Capronia coronata CBS 617.96]
MLSSLLRPARSRPRRDSSPLSSSYAPTSRSPDVAHINTQNHRRRTTQIDTDDIIHEEQEEESVDGEDDGEGDYLHEDEEDEDGVHHGDSDEDGPDDTTPLLPIFSAAHLDALPVFALTHAIRTLVTSRCDTVLTWEQLRSPQVSQFLLKPIEQDIRSNHLNAATHYALMANCLQYSKEAAVSAVSSGTNKTRAMVCELLAIKLLRDFSTRELIDALSYDFDPLQGQSDPVSADEEARRRAEGLKRHSQRPARISCFEIAIRAQSKRFLSHPLVVRQLEAIWAGTIVFHSAADHLHRKLPLARQTKSYGAIQSDPTARTGSMAVMAQLPRRAVTLYNPRDASLLKLSRLRVPRYRNIMSTLSFAVLLSLFVAVLVQRSIKITTLEVVFWFWAAGFMLDEIVGFNEQGFSLYLASFWNTFDLGILLILMVHLALRIYGIVMPDVKKHTVANMAYDVLAADAILLFPRLFSVLDHYRYFSPLLIAFRYMAADLVAVSLLILISCSGFFVALTLSFGNEGVDTPSSVAYALLQIVMGFTPAAWDRWDKYNLLGRMILTLFLFICHFLVVTILITVLTNSFMAVVQNANEEHQFLFAVNTISHVKSDALFSYVAPTNVIQWLLVPLRYLVPFRQYVKVNRTVIKITHFPLLFSIFLYEKAVLQSTVFDTIDLVERRGRSKRTMARKPTHLTRAPSIATFRQDKALEEVFRQPYDSTMRSGRQSRNQRKTSNVVNTWMKDMGDEIASPPLEQDRRIVESLEGRAAVSRLLRPASRVRTFSRRTMSVASDPEEFATHADFLSPSHARPVYHSVRNLPLEEPSALTDAEGDDELRSSESMDEEETTQLDHGSSDEAESAILQRSFGVGPPELSTTEQLATSLTPAVAGPATPLVHTRPSGTSGDAPSPSAPPAAVRPPQHSRNVSSATMIFKPVAESGTDNSSSLGEYKASPRKPQSSAPGSGMRTPVSKPTSGGAGHRTPKRTTGGTPKRSALLPNKNDAAFRSAPNLAELRGQSSHSRRKPPLEMDLVSDIGDNRAIGGGYVGALPASFAAQMSQSLLGPRQTKAQFEEQEMLAKIMMARMNSLEEGFREVIHEMRETMRHDNARSQSRGRPGRPVVREKRAKGKETYHPTAIGGEKENVDPEREHDASSGMAAQGTQGVRSSQEDITEHGGEQGGDGLDPVTERASG